jgi:hypothetical protein
MKELPDGTFVPNPEWSIDKVSRCLLLLEDTWFAVSVIEESNQALSRNLIC